MGGDGIVGGDGVLKAKSSGVIGERVKVDEFSLELMKDEDVPLVDGVLDDALGALVLRLKLEWKPWNYLRLKMNEEDDGLEVKSCLAFYLEKMDSMATLYVRRSGRLSDQKKPNKGDDEEEVIDLTIKDWDGAGDVIHGKKALEKKDNIEKGTGKEKIIA
ncbi:hypothetical protein Tco_0548929, partial [Tanacetum coccineum]